DDTDVGNLLARFTMMPMDEVKRLAALQGAEINEAKKILAHEATKLNHGEEAALHAAETAQKVFEQGGVGGDLPHITVERARLSSGIAILDLLVEAGFATSKGEARRLVQGGGIRCNDNIISDDKFVAHDSDLTAEGYIKLSAGKKRHALVKV
ncbi:MAG TPA: S4 domain-containing protein, partial [Micavibrio sp.]